MKQVCTCPNCGAQLELRSFLTLLHRHSRISHNTPGQLQSTAPTGPWRQFVHRVFKNRPLTAPRQPRQPDIVVRSEIKTSPKQTWINELKIPATPEQLKMLGIIYVERAQSWSRDNTVASMNVSQTWHNKIAQSFLALRFLKAAGYNRYALTEQGQRFLAYYLYDHPWRKGERGNNQ